MENLRCYITYKRNEMVNFDSTLLSLNLYSDSDGALRNKMLSIMSHCDQHSSEKVETYTPNVCIDRGKFEFDSSKYPNQRLTRNNFWSKMGKNSTSETSEKTKSKISECLCGFQLNYDIASSNIQISTTDVASASWPIDFSDMTLFRRNTDYSFENYQLPQTNTYTHTRTRNENTNTRTHTTMNACLHFISTFVFQWPILFS